MDLPIDDLMKVGTGGAGGVGIMTLIARFLRGDIKRIEMAQNKINADIYAKVSEANALIARNELEAANQFVKKPDFDALRNHIDLQFIDQRNFFLQLFRQRKE